MARQPAQSSLEKAAAGDSPVRARLIAAALGELARHGVEATSVRALNRAAGAKHQSAIYYHFGDKWGLVQAVLDEATDEMLTTQREALKSLETPTPRDVLEAMIRPFLNFARSAGGRDRLLLMARLSSESGTRGQAMLAAKVRPVAQMAEAHLQAALPAQAPQALGAKLLYGLNALLHTLADKGMHKHWDLGAVPNPELVTYLLDFLEGGLRFSSIAREQTHD